MDCRIPIDYVTIEGDPSKTLTITRKSNLADDPLVVGPRYQPKDILCTWSSYLGTHTSGVLCKIGHSLYILFFTYHKYSSTWFTKRNQDSFPNSIE